MRHHAFRQRPALAVAAAVAGIAILALALGAHAETPPGGSQAEREPHHHHHQTAPAPDAAVDVPATDHGSMRSGLAPADARDPHAYSGGFVRGSGPYALPDGNKLTLADEHAFGSLLADQFEAVRTDGDTSAAYELQGWYGRTYDRLVLKAKGEYDAGQFHEARTELLWDHAVAAFWGAQLGLRHDGGEGPNRRWLAFGVQGLAPYWFELYLAGYLGESGRTALRLEAKYELLFTQRLVLQPKLEMDFYGKADPERDLGSGLAETKAALRLRYEWRREFAPYIGVEWLRRYGGTKALARAQGQDDSQTRYLAGLRFWF
jgi:copper resistance protein B